MRRRGWVVVMLGPLVLTALSAPACSSSTSRGGPCNLAHLDLSPGGQASLSGASGPVLADITSTNGMTGYAPVTSLRVESSGAAVALGRDGPRHARLDEAGVARLQACIDGSGILTLDSSYPSQNGRSVTPGHFCGISDASSVTVTARGSNDIEKAVTAYALGSNDSTSCDLGQPKALLEAYAGLSDLRDQIVAVGSAS
jgi:hypothetical protein